MMMHVRMLKLCSLFVILTLSFASPLVFADGRQAVNGSAVNSAGQDQHPHKSIYNESEVQVIGSKENVKGLWGSGAYLDSHAINDHSYDDVNDVLRTVPGVYLREEDGYGLFPNISLRGVDGGRSGKVTVMEDGVLTAPAPYSAPSAYYSPTVARMSGIEVLKGSSQIKYGPHTTGGIVNYISTPVPNKQTFFAKVTTGGDFREDAEIRSHVYQGNTFETGAGNIGYLAEFYQRATSGFKRIDGKPDFNKSEDDTGFVKFDMMWKMFWEPDTEMYQRFEGKIGYTSNEAEETYTGLNDEDFRNNPYRRYAATRFDNIESKHLRSYLRHVIELVEDVLRITTTGYMNRFYRNWFKLNDRITPAAGGGRLGISQAIESPAHLAVLKGDAAGTFRYRNNRRYYYLGGVQSVMNLTAEILNMVHDIEFGVRYHQDRIRRYQDNVTFTQDGEGRVVGEVGSPRGSAGNRRQHTQAVAFHIQDKIEMGPVTVVPGLRWEHIDQTFFDYNSNIFDTADYDVLAPGVGIILQPTENWSLFGGWHRGFSVPSPGGASVATLREEQSDAFELGTRVEKGSFQTEWTFFYTEFSDLIVADSIGGAGSGADENAGDVRSLGVEAKIEIDPAKEMGKEFNTPTYVAATYTHATLRGNARSTDPESIFSGGRDGNDVPYVPHWMVSAGTGIEYKRFRAYLNAVFYDKTYTTADNTDNQVNPLTGVRDARFGETDRFLVFDLSAHYDLSENVSLFMNLQNITDQEYITSRHPHGPRPGRPFSMHGGVKVEFA